MLKFSRNGLERRSTTWRCRSVNIFGKIIEIVATRGQILRLGLNAPNSISAGAPPKTSLGRGSLQRFPDLLGGFKWSTSKWMDSRGKKCREAEVRERERRGREGINVELYHWLAVIDRKSTPAYVTLLFNFNYSLIHSNIIILIARPLLLLR